MKKIGIITLLLFWAFQVHAAENCTAENKKAICKQEVVKEKVAWACKLITEKGKDAKDEIKKMRYDCCGEPNYVWVQTSEEKPKMIMHPIKPMLDGKDITDNKDPDGKPLFVEFVKAVNKTPAGAWVDYKWTKFGEKDPTPKTSWVQKCGAENWIAGSGTWK